MTGMRWANNQYFNPRNISNLVLWLDAKDPSNNGVRPSNSSSISTWKDKSINGYDFTQGTGANQPTYNTTYINSKPAVKFDGTNDRMSSSNTALLNSITSDMTAFIVVNYASITAFNANFTSDPVAVGISPELNLFMPFSVTSKTLFDFGDTGSGRITVTPWGGSISTNYIVTAVASVSNSIQKVYLNNVQQVSGTTPQTCSFSTSYNLTIGALNNSGYTDFLNAGIGEFIVYNKYLSTTENSNVYNYLKNKWGI